MKNITETDSGYENDGFEKDLMTYIESSQKGIDYVDSLVPKDSDVIGAVTDLIKDSEFTPSYVKYHDGEKWVEINLREQQKQAKEQ